MESDTTNYSELIFEQIPNIESHKLIGIGIIGASFLTTSKKNEQKIVKLINPKLLDNKGYINSVKKGLEIIDYQNHPNLLPHHYQETSSGEIYFTSNYLANNSIGSLVKETGRLEINSGLEIIRKTCDILKFFERIKSPHLGLHPENIFKEPDGGIYLKDFEWNRRFFKTMEDRIAFGPGICFMAPEYIRGNGIDHSADIYSLGILLYYILTRRLPFHGNVENQLQKKDKLDYPDISEIHKNIPIYIGDLIRKMIDPNKANRYQTFEQLSSDLEDILKKRYLNDPSSRKPSPIQNKPGATFSERKATPLASKSTPNSLPSTSENKIINSFKQINLKYLLSAVFVAGLLLLLNYILNVSPKSDQISKNNNSSTTVVKNEIKKKETKPKQENAVAIEETPEKELVKENVEEVKEEKIEEIKEKVKMELQKKIENNKEAKSFSKRLNSIMVVQENFKNESKVSRDTLNRIFAEEIAKVEFERQQYWDEKKESLKKAFTEKDEKISAKLIEDIKNETANDEVIKNKIFHLRVETQRLDPEESKSFSLDSDSLALKESIENKSLSFIQNHDYSSLITLLSNAIQKEKNDQQKQLYIDQLEFYEHADKVKNVSQNIPITSRILLRSLSIDEDGDLEAVSSKGFHVKDSNNKIIPWKNISAKALSALVAKYEPNTLGECISLLIFASRAGDFIAMQKSLKTIELKYGASVNSPLIKESKEKLNELKDYLVEDDIKLQLSLIKTLKARNNIKAKKDAETLIRELKNEYLSNPIYKKYEAEIIDISAALDQIK